jgi:hypothetical protein
MTLEKVVTIDTLALTDEPTSFRARPEETRYGTLLVRVMRAVVALIVAGFLIGGFGMGYGYAHRNDRSTEWAGDSCMSSLNADSTCGYKPGIAIVAIESTVGGTLGALGGLVATFGIEVSIALYLAARKYLRS